MATGFGGPGSAKDYKINVIQTSANLTVQQCAPNNPNRYAMILSDSAGGINFSTNAGNLANLKGEIQMAVGGNFLILTFRDLGPWVQSALYCLRNSGGSNVFVTEIIYVPSG